MTCLETLPPTALRERLLAVLETQRLVLRAPQLEHRLLGFVPILMVAAAFTWRRAGAGAATCAKATTRRTRHSINTEANRVCLFIWV